MNYFKLSILLFLLSSCSILGEYRPDIPPVVDGDTLDTYTKKIVTLANGERVRFGDGSLLIKLPQFRDIEYAKKIASKFGDLCYSLGGRERLNFKNEAPLEYSETDLKNVFSISDQDIKKYGTKPLYNYSKSLYDKKPSVFEYSNIYPSSMTGILRGVLTAYRYNKIDNNEVYFEENFRNVRGYCLSGSSGKGAFKFAWFFSTVPIDNATYNRYLEMKRNKVRPEYYINKPLYSNDLWIFVESKASFFENEKEIIQNFYTAKKEEEEYEKKYKMYLENETKEKIRLAKIRKQQLIAEKERRQKQLIINRKRVKRFRSNLHSGDESNCGLVIEVREKIALVQTFKGQRWIKRSSLTPVGISSCYL